MRKKILFAGVALTTLFAACSNEEIFNEQAVVGQENRPMTEVALSFNEENVSLGLDAETRSYFGVANGGYQWIFEDGDRIGGLLMDEWNGEACGIENFTLTDYVHTNYAFIRETGADGKTQWPKSIRHRPPCSCHLGNSSPERRKQCGPGHCRQPDRHPSPALFYHR